jgi:galactoside O-acetyltransferase
MKDLSPRKLASRLRHQWLRRRVRALGADAWIARGVRLEGPYGIRVGVGARVETGVVLRANTAHPRGISLGDGASAKEYAVLNANGGCIELGARSWLGPHCLIYGNGNVSIGADVLIAAHTTISSVSHITERTDVSISAQGVRCAPVVIEDDVWIGLNVSVLPGVTVGSGSIIGAGAVVTRDVPAGCVVTGVPARVVSWRTPARARGCAA